MEAERIHRQIPHVIGTEPPFDVKAVAEHYGLAVDAYPFKTITGCLVNLGPGQGHAIGVNRRHNRGRRRFTVAHELYHYLAHRQLIPVLACSGSSGQNTRTQEIEANAFAAELLAPEPLVRDYWQRYGKVPKLAEEFGLSVQAMRARVEELGYIKTRRR